METLEILFKFLGFALILSGVVLDWVLRRPGAAAICLTAGSGLFMTSRGIEGNFTWTLIWAALFVLNGIFIPINFDKYGLWGERERIW